MNRSKNPSRFLTPDESSRVAAAIAEAEGRTSAEIKLVVVRHCWRDIRTRAAEVFRKFGLENTRLRNCALIMLVTTNREFLIYGDQGIHEKVGQGFWDDVRDVMAGRFRKGEFGPGLVEGIRRIGEKLAAHFPHEADDVNEVSDEVAYDD